MVALILLFIMFQMILLKSVSWKTGEVFESSRFSTWKVQENSVKLFVQSLRQKMTEMQDD